MKEDVASLNRNLPLPTHPTVKKAKLVCLASFKKPWASVCSYWIELRAKSAKNINIFFIYSHWYYIKGGVEVVTGNANVRYFTSLNAAVLDFREKTINMIENKDYMFKVLKVEQVGHEHIIEKLKFVDFLSEADFNQLIVEITSENLLERFKETQLERQKNSKW